MTPNPYTQELYSQCVARYSIESVGMKNSEWLCENTKIKGLPFSFNRYPYQRDVVDDEHPNQVGMKPSQVGWSEIIQRWALCFLKRNQSTKGIYAYPDDEMRKKNAQTRVLPLAEVNGVFNPPTPRGDKPIRSIQLIQIEQSFMYMTGSKEGDATSTDADFVVIDERDLHDPAMVTLFRSRVLNSDWGWIKNFSTPTYTEFGVDKDFQESDQTYYMIKCRHCNHWQFPMFQPQFIVVPGLTSDVTDLTDIDQGMVDSQSLDLMSAYVCCEKCRMQLDLGSEDNREWVSKYPSRTYRRGRKINPFSVATRPPAKIFTELFEYKSKDNMKGFKNTVLGEAEDSSSARISEDAINACYTAMAEFPAARRDIPAWIGCDMGHTCHITVGLGWRVEAIEVVRFFTCPIADLKHYMKALKDDFWVMGGNTDRHPESLAAADIRDLTEGLVVPCEYRGEKEINFVEAPDGSVSHIQANRTILLDAVKTSITKNQITFSGYQHRKVEIKTHLRNMVREESPETPATWRKLDSQDHFFHSLGLMLNSLKMVSVKELKFGVPQSVVCVAAADVGGYNSDIYGNITKMKETPWQTSYLKL